MNMLLTPHSHIFGYNAWMYTSLKMTFTILHTVTFSKIYDMLVFGLVLEQKNVLEEIITFKCLLHCLIIWYT